MERSEISRTTLQQAAEGISIDYKRVLYSAWQYWYFILLSLIIGVTIAYLSNRYATRIYPITASIIVKEEKDISGGELIYNNPLVNFRRNYLNETYILKSYPLIQRVIEDLNFDASFYREGNILTTEVYQELPIMIIPDRKKIKQGFSCNFTIRGKHQFELQSTTESKRFTIGDSIHFQGFHGVVVLKDTSVTKDFINRPFIFAYTPSSLAAARYVEGLTAEWAEEGAGVLNLSMLGANIKKEIDFMNGLILMYQRFDLEKKNETASRTVDFISKQLENISDSLLQVEGHLARFKSKNSSIDLDGEALRLYQQVQGFESEKMGLTIRKNYFNYLQEYIDKSENLDQIILPTSMGVDDPILNELLVKMMDTQLEIKLSNRPENPMVNEARKRIVEIKKDILASIRNVQYSDNSKLSFMDKQIRSVEQQLSHVPTAQRTLVSIKRNYTLMENLYIFLLQKRSEAAISQASNTSDIIIVNPPRVSSAISPKTTSNYAISVFAGLALPLLIFVLFEFLDTRVQSKEDVERITSIPFIGGVGHKKAEANLAVFNQPKSIIAESFRALRSNLNYFIGQNTKAVILITSSISGEGKTFASLNLASVYALSGKRTLIVGADMRKPKLYSDFELENDIGLSNYLAGLADFKSICKKTTYENLDLISGGPVPPNPSELLLSPRIQLFIEEAKKHYDCIIIDTPPMAIVTDAFLLAPFADHTLFLVRQNYTPKNLLRTVEDYFSAGKLKNVSIVLNDIYRSGPGYGFGYGYAYGYGYHYGYGYSYGASGRKNKKNGDGYYEE